MILFLFLVYEKSYENLVKDYSNFNRHAIRADPGRRDPKVQKMVIRVKI